MLSFERSVLINAPVERVFAFHAQPDALQKLIPPGQPVELISREGGIEKGARVVLRMKFGPFSRDWVALHTAYVSNVLFEDIQVEGPFKSWRHQHRFAPEGTGTRLTDHIDFELPGGAVSELVAGWAVKAQLEKMFTFRHQVTKRECEC